MSSSFEGDFVMRQIRQLMAVVDAILRTAADDGNYAAAQERLRAAATETLGADYEVLGRLAPESVALVVPGADKQIAVATLWGREGDLLLAAGRRDEALRLYQRAIVLFGHCARLHAGQRATCREHADALVGHGDGECRRAFQQWFGGDRASRG